MSPDYEIREMLGRAEQLMLREPVESIVPRLLTLMGLKMFTDSAAWLAARGYQLSDPAYWATIKQASHLNRAIMDALEAIAQKNLSLQWLAYADPAWFAPEDVVGQLMLLIDTVDLTVTEVGDWVTLGRQVTMVMDRKSARWGVGRPTPSWVNELIAAFLVQDIRSTGSLYDPTCGVGGTLVVVGSGSGDPETLMCYGQDVSFHALYMCTWNLLLHGMTRFQLAQGDVLTAPQFVSEDGQRVQVFDYVIADPPWGLMREVEWGPDPYQRFRYGPLKGRRADYGFLQHVLASLQKSGMGLVLMPPGVLFRSGYEQEIRRNVIQADVLDAIVMLPGGSLTLTGLPVALLIFRPQKPVERRQRIRMVDASVVTPERRRGLDESVVARIVQAIRQQESVPGFARTVSVGEIAAHDFRLVPGEYVVDPVEIVSPQEMTRRVHQAEEVYTEAQRILTQELRQLDELFRTTT
ncbi:N-6 DNA methylase [Sulfobacillus thermosulfidooxidans]|uniref:N-6 DNA methylase n=1 Tax=Sulfobacillus thermosulfidooxidans TaxID=28034 RepID=UPI0006B57195|nr:N-6 DNA methylase [Sulfobacillus thermosulfidooxidans]